MPALAFGAVIGAGFAAAILWSLFRTLRARESLRMAHSAAGALSLSLIAALYAAEAPVTAVAGALLAGAGLIAMLMERGFARLFPVSQIAVGVAAALGAPLVA